MTLKELAGNKVTAAQISSIENGKCNPSDELLAYIAEKLEVDIEYFTLTDRERLQKKFQKVIDSINYKLDKENINEVLNKIKDYEENLDLLSDAQKGYFYYCIGKKFYFNEEYDSSFVEFSKSLVYYLKTNNYDIISDIYICLGNCSYFNNKYELAFGYYKNSEELIEREYL
ncbi:helix-turn-helix transcriptional regulator [Caloramator sp. mosi_1]|uniref:helix-turn-helix domain-containing protein n=1 Tax=Caloramator sp. mosi_1 TaxID=3023090 RepID=UPI002362A14A|nr:helix-turn-helix transcriptional regulator [Caloramator sp. mosi_1]WDC83528.1 helix-turn-helix transcriptional regulator [Caloramator sp. mosi_1]